MHRTRSNMAAWMIGMAVIVVGMVIAARPSLAQTPQRAGSVVIGSDQPPAGGGVASSDAAVPGKPIAQSSRVPQTDSLRYLKQMADSLGVPLKGNTYIGVRRNRRSTNVIIIQRANPLRPTEAWNLGPALRLPMTTTGVPRVEEQTDGSTTGAFTAGGPVIAAGQGLSAQGVSVEADCFGCPMPQTDSLRYLADEGLANFSHIATAKPAPRERVSLATVAPGLLPFFNNAPVFGLAGTVEENFWHRTQLTGDWGGARTDLVEHGIFIDFYTTGAYQNVTSGGLKTGGAYVQNTQLSINIDTARAGLWSGGLFHFTVQSRYGSSPEETFTVGSYVPQYTGLVLPGPLLFQNIYPSEYFLVQSFTKQFSVVVGKISDVFIPDQTLFGDSFRYFFANFNFNKNPMTTNAYHPTALAVIAVWVPKQWLALVGGVLDPFTQPNTIAANAFNNGVNVYVQAILSYKARGRPGQFAPAFNWSNQPKIDFDAPFGRLSPAQVPAAVSALLGQPPSADLPVNFRRDTKFAIASFSQYLVVKEPPAEIPKMLVSGQQLRGIGVFGRLGYAPRGSNTLSRDASVAMFGRGLLSSRPYDSYGVGFYYNGISGDLKEDIERLTGGPPIKNEKGIEVFYDFAITPAIRVNPSYQHIWDPLTAQVVTNHRWANVFLLRFNLAL
ncbi:MAG TPA: carbohydrate porin [Blastocatellia bacterium]|nr:carbohydrate porin [Blastocatellia bacterium]